MAPPLLLRAFFAEIEKKSIELDYSSRNQPISLLQRARKRRSA